VAIALLPEICESRSRPLTTATLVIVCSPIRAADGTLRVLRQAIAADGPLAAVIPSRLAGAQVSVNGGIVAPEDWSQWQLLPGDEVLVLPQWGEPVTGILLTIAIGLIVSAAATALSYVLFPPPKAHNIQHTPDDPTFSFEGIRTTLGPGAVVPVIYGIQRTGGQLLTSHVDQTLTVLDDGVSSRRITAQAAPATLSLLLALGEGPVDNVRTPTAQINGQPGANFPGLELYTALGTQDQQALPTFGEVANTFATGQTLHEPGSVFWTTTAPVDAFVLNIVFNQGLYVINKKGEKIDNLVDLAYRFRNVASPDWSPWSSFDIVAQRTAPVRFGIRRENIPLAQYQIEVLLEHAQVTENAQFEPTLESVTEIRRNEERYPGTVLLGLRALATDSLQGAIPNVTIEVAGRKVRVGTFSAVPSYSDNPAWCVMDFLTNTTYGLGVPDSQIDLGSFSAWADYCNQVIDGEPRHRLNYTLDRDVRAQQALLEMAGSARTLLFKSEGVWVARPTRDDPPVLLLSWANCTDLKLTYTRDPDRVNVIEARFANENEDYAQDVLTWPTLENWPAEVRKSSLELRGVTKPSRVMRAMQFELNRRRFENLALEVTCNLEAVPLQPHDIFRFSHPLPGWGVSGRVQDDSTTTRLYLDQAVTFGDALTYLVYVRYADGTTEVRQVAYPGQVTQRHIDVGPSLSQHPTARVTLYAWGWVVGPADSAVKLFRVIQMQRTSDNRVRIQAMIHNPTVYDEPTAEALPVTTLLMNPEGPPPPLTALIASEVSRIQASGASLRVVNLSWDVAHLGPGLAPYGGALILRRTVWESGHAGSAEAGITPTGEIQAATDLNVNYAPIHQVSGHVLDFDDYTIVSGVTYVYRVVPMSQRGVPNYPGSREVAIHVAGPTTPNFFPGTTTGLRLKGKALGDFIWEGRDVHFEWDPMNSTGLFTDTFFIVDYVVEIWAPGQQYLMRRTAVPSRGHAVTLEWTYTLEQNAEDQLQAGQAGARRDLTIFVWGRTNTGRVTLTPASITVTNPPPDMGDMVPILTPVVNGAKIEFDQFVEPRDFDHYAVFVDTINPPQAIYEHVAVGGHGQGVAVRVFKIDGLLTGTHYFTYVLPFDTFGPGIPTGIVEFVAGGITAESIDNTPPAMPTGLALTTGSFISPDGTVQSWVSATWNPSPEADVARYEVHFRIQGQLGLTSFTVAHPTTTVRLDNIGGNLTVFAKVLASDGFSNHSPFTPEVAIVTGRDTTPPAPTTAGVAHGHFQSVVLQWNPPPDADYAGGEVWRSGLNDVTTASFRGLGWSDFIDKGLNSNEGFYYWLRMRDTSGNTSTFFPAAPDALVGITIPATTPDIQELAITETKIANDSISTPKLQANSVDANKVVTAHLITHAAQIDDALISDAHIVNLSASKIATGSLQANVGVGVGQNMFIDGVNSQIYVYDGPPAGGGTLRVRLGKLGSLNTQWGLQVFNETGALMWNFASGATPAGIQDAAVTADKIAVGSIHATHLVADQVVITSFAQIAAAQINDGHIVNLTSSKLLSGTIQAHLQLGVGENIFIQGDLARFLVYDRASPPVLRVWLGKIELTPGVFEYGLRLFNSFGQLMWDFNTGSSTFGIQDLAVTNAKIANLSANKIDTGYLQANIRVGVGNNLFLDGVNNVITVYDDQSPQHLRVLLGKVNTGPTDYGLYIWNAASQLMWAFDSGAQTEGINPFAVTVSVSYTSAANLSLTTSENEAASLGFAVNAGDQVWLHGIVEGQTSDTGDQLVLRLREDTATGTIHHETHLQGAGGVLAPMSVQAVWQSPGTGTKTFKLTFARPFGVNAVAIRNVYFVALRRRR
jgi:Putative phage tail protein